jgi:GntR family transcriptional regulator
MRYHQLYVLLGQALHDGTVRPGQALPSEPQLMRLYAVSRTTVRRALAQLERDGRIERRRGSGTYALATQEDEPPGRFIDAKDLTWVAANTTARLLKFEHTATPWWLHRLCPAFGSTALKIERIRSYQGKPFVYLTSFIPMRLAPRINKQALGNLPITFLLDRIGAVAHTGEQITRAMLANAQLAENLCAPIGSPILEIRRLVRDAAGRPIEHQCFHYRADLYQQRTFVERRRETRAGTPSGWIELAS